MEHPRNIFTGTPLTSITRLLGLRAEKPESPFDLGLKLLCEAELELAEIRADLAELSPKP
jgi:hypothetical protein